MQSKELKTIIGANIALLMKLYKVNRKEICKELGIPYTTFCDWVNGKTYPRVESMEQLGKYFNIDAGDLFFEMKENSDMAKRISAYANAMRNSIQEGCSVPVVMRHKTLEERAESYGGKLNLDGELDWGEPIGREVW